MPTPDYPAFSLPVFVDITTSQRRVVEDLLWRYAESGRRTEVTITKQGLDYEVSIAVPADEPEEETATSSSAGSPVSV